MSDDGITYAKDAPVAYVNGICLPTGRKPVSSTEIMDSLKTVLAMDYEGKEDKYKGLTRKEAILCKMVDLAEEGNLPAILAICDRIMGKPLQQVNSLTVNTSLQDFLEALHLDREGNQAPREGGVDARHSDPDPAGKGEVDPFSD